MNHFEARSRIATYYFAGHDQKESIHFVAGYQLLVSVVDTLVPGATLCIDAIAGAVIVEIHSDTTQPSDAADQIRAAYVRIVEAVSERRRQAAQFLTSKDRDEAVGTPNLLQSCEPPQDQVIKAIDNARWSDADHAMALSMYRWSIALSPESLRDLLGVANLRLVTKGAFKALISPIWVSDPRTKELTAQVSSFSWRATTSQLETTDSSLSGRIRSDPLPFAEALSHRREIRCDAKNLVDLMGLKNRKGRTEFLLVGRGSVPDSGSDENCPTD